MRGKLSHDDRGFGFVIELVIIAAILSTIGFVGFHLYQKRTGDNLKTGPVNAITAAHTGTGFDIFKSLNQNETTNVVISPASISLALSMVYNGANGSTAADMQKTLHYQGLDLDKVNRQSRSLIDGLQSSEDIELSIANSTWSRQGRKINPDFSKLLTKYYKAENTPLDFDSPEAPKTINNWADDKTKGKIPQIISEIPEDAIMYLINATYFNGTWTTEFDKNSTRDEPFALADGSHIRTPLMSQSGKFNYSENDDFQAASLPYGKSKRFSMYVFLPKDLQKFTTSLNEDNWNDWLKGFTEREGTIELPRFKTEYGKDLSNTLKGLGMQRAFSDSADFTGIGPGLRISEVQHKTLVDVSEKGTEAAAVTSVGVGITSARAEPDDHFYMIVDRPFFFAIRDNNTGELLFVGDIRNPAEK